MITLIVDIEMLEDTLTELIIANDYKPIRKEIVQLWKEIGGEHDFIDILQMLSWIDDKFRLVDLGMVTFSAMLDSLDIYSNHPYFVQNFDGTTGFSLDRDDAGIFHFNINF